MNLYSNKIWAVIIILSMIIPFTTVENNKNVVKENPLLSTYHINEKIQSEINNSDVILQAFYWAVPTTTANGTWYNTIASRMNEISNLGFTYIWLPPPSKTYGPGLPDSNGSQVGYEPYDYYDLGQYNQQGSINTRYGNKTDLLNLITLANNSGISTMADIVLNHNRGGYPQPDGLDFMNISSGLFPRNASDFNCGDGPAFSTFPDLCTTNPYVRSEILKWGQWLYDQIGFRGWRFDYTIGYNASTVKAWVDAIGGLSMVEYWQPDVFSIMNYLQNVPSETKALDFPLMYTFINLFSRNGNFPMKSLTVPSTSILMTDPNRAVTFVDNHDTVRTAWNNIALHRDFMYAFILLYAGGTPAVFWKDLYPNDPCIDPAGTCPMQNDLHPQELSVNLRKLLEIRKDYASGNGSVIYADNDLWIYQRESNPGLILAMNDNPDVSNNVTISTQYKNVVLYDLMGKGKALQVDNQGNAYISVPPLSYLVYVPFTNPPSNVITDILQKPDTNSITTNTVVSSVNTTTPTSVGFDLSSSLTMTLSSFLVLFLIQERKRRVK